ncbi:AsmA family protein [Pseudomonas sp. RIT-PI-AD]|uniref:AsmA family protein n=1 Tax=Pseudomonas sp. RIT-PI-AD TaxID=3035294 RepID=UPI0021DB73A3|nr:AsmA family protein [Pseudomonas sp. RIT-PI-AD]
MTRGRKLFIWILACLLLAILALVVFVATFDWNRIKPTLNEKVSAALNRPFAIEGNLAVAWQRQTDEPGWRAWVPWPHVSAERLTLGNPDWAKGPRFVGLDKVEASLSPLPLLWKRVVIPHIQLTGPSAGLERLADGRNNWTFDLGEQSTDQDEPSPWKLEIGAIGFDQGQVVLDDQSLKTHLELQVDPLGKPIPFNEIVGKPAPETGAEPKAAPQDYAFGWRLKGVYREQRLTGSGKVGGLLALQDAQRPFPVQAEVSVGSTRVAVAGTLTDPKNLGALDLRLRLAGSSLGNLYPLTGVTLPDTPAYSTDGRLVARLHDPDGATYRYEDFNGRIGDSDIHGELTFVARQPRPKLSGSLTSEQLLFADLAPLIGADSNAEKKARGAPSNQPADKALPVEAFRTERWRSMDADVSFTGKRIVQSDKLPINDLFTHVVLNDGDLTLEPLRFGVAGGALETHLGLNGRVTPLLGRAQISARGLKLKQLFPGFAPMQTSFGELNGDADIRGAGNSVAALLGSANGQVKMLVNDGAVSRKLMEIAGLNVGNYLIGELFGDKDVKINCAAADVGITNGLLGTRLVVFDTENAIVRIDGKVNFANEQMDLDIDPESKGFRVFSLRSPLYVRGTFKKPDAGVKTGPLLARGAGLLALGAFVAPAAGLLALVAPSEEQASQCEPLLKQMQASNRERAQAQPAKRK